VDAGRTEEGGEVNAIKFPAIVARVRTLADGGIRVELDLPEDCIPEMAMLAETRKEGIPLLFTATVEGEPQLRGNNGNDRSRRKR
jgi:hypothetical protein